MIPKWNVWAVHNFWIMVIDIVHVWCLIVTKLNCLLFFLTSLLVQSFFETTVGGHVCIKYVRFSMQSISLLNTDFRKRMLKLSLKESILGLVYASLVTCVKFWYMTWQCINYCCGWLVRRIMFIKRPWIFMIMMNNALQIKHIFDNGLTQLILRTISLVRCCKSARC